MKHPRRINEEPELARNSPNQLKFAPLRICEAVKRRRPLGVLTPKSFDECATKLAAVNHLSLELAGLYLSLIGDTPELDADRKLVVRNEDGVELARLRCRRRKPHNDRAGMIARQTHREQAIRFQWACDWVQGYGIRMNNSRTDSYKRHLDKLAGHFENGTANSFEELVQRYLEF
ncbi:MAG: hypothetical protein H0U23_05740 [Blastocatellia bacterium]|nr:hypothetical protein [Blastocatellia bacterium]